MTKMEKKGLLFLAPAFILLAAFFLFPALLALFFSFTDMALSGPKAANYGFVGLDNFIAMGRDPGFKGSIAKTLVFIFFSAIVGQVVLGFMIALLMKEKNILFRRAVGTTVVAGWVAPEIIVALCWLAFLAEKGTLNAALGWAGLKPVAWLFRFPMASVIVANIWHGTAFSMISSQAALDGIPKEVEESARLEGVSRLQMLRYIALPLVKGALAVNVLLVSLQTLGVFGLIYAMTGGGPGSATQTLTIFMYNQAFINYQLGYGTAISLVILALGALASLLCLKFMKVKI